jgi:integrase
MSSPQHRRTGRRGRSIKLLHYVFCTGKGFVESRSNIAKRGFNPIQIAAGLSEPLALDRKGNPRLDKHGQPRLRGKYSLHALRHPTAAGSSNGG